MAIPRGLMSYTARDNYQRGPFNPGEGYWVGDRFILPGQPVPPQPLPKPPVAPVDPTKPDDQQNRNGIAPYIIPPSQGGDGNGGAPVGPNTGLGFDRALSDLRGFPNAPQIGPTPTATAEELGGIPPGPPGPMPQMPTRDVPAPEMNPNDMASANRSAPAPEMSPNDMASSSRSTAPASEMDPNDMASAPSQAPGMAGAGQLFGPGIGTIDSPPSMPAMTTMPSKEQQEKSKEQLNSFLRGLIYNGLSPFGLGPGIATIGPSFSGTVDVNTGTRNTPGGLAVGGGSQSQADSPTGPTAADVAADVANAEGDPFYKGGRIPPAAMDDVPGPDDQMIGAQTGEFMMRKSAVKHYGTGLMHAMNKKQIPKKKLMGLLHSSP